MRKYLGKTAGVPAVNVFAVFRERRVPAGAPGKVFAGITITLDNKLRTMKNTVTYLSTLLGAASVSNAQHVQLKSDAGNVVCSLNAEGKIDSLSFRNGAGRKWSGSAPVRLAVLPLARRAYRPAESGRNAMGKSVIAGRHVRATRLAQAAGRWLLAIPRHRDRPRPIPF